MRICMKAPFILGAAMLLAGPPVLAGAGIVTTFVTPLSENVTYSTPATTSPSRPAMTTYLGWAVTIASDPSNTNTINNVRFTATASVADSAEKATFFSADGASCVTTNADRTSIECSIGQLRAGETYPTFAVFFKSPEKVTNSIADDAGSDKVTFSGTTFYAEGTGGLENSVPPNSTVVWSSAPSVTLGTCNPTQVKSALPKSGGTFFTGSADTCSAGDPFSVSVNVPSPPIYSTVLLDEYDVTSETTCTSLGNFYTCYKAQVQINAVEYMSTSGNYLTVVLRILASNMKPGFKLNNVLVQYVPDDTNASTINLTSPDRTCPTPTTPTYDNIPCLARKVFYKNKSVPGWTPELDGAVDLIFLNNKNGGFKAF